jgi:ketosteroid isomerase-like protein
VVEIERWTVEPLERRRRGLDERLSMFAPALTRRLGRRLEKMPAGAPARRAALTRGVRASYAALNRNDYDSSMSLLHPEFVIEPPGKAAGDLLDFEPEYHGPDGFRAFMTQWKAGFEYFRHEPREIADAGGPYYAVRIAATGRFAGSGAELQDEWGATITLRDGLVYRSEDRYEWRDALERLEELAGLAALEGRLAGAVG